MAKKKVCKKCRIFVKSSECPKCKGTDLTTTWKGRIIIFSPEHSEIAKKMDIKEKGEYAIKIR